MSCLFSHKWQWVPSNGQVVRFGKYGPNESYTGAHYVSINGCELVCSECRKKKKGSLSEHQPKKVQCDIVCQKCGAKIRIEHQYEDVPGKCLRCCTVCGEEYELPHKMERRVRDGHCEQYCTNCGMIIEGHAWNQVEIYIAGWEKRDGCTCITCGAQNPDGIHDWKKIEDGDFTNINICKRCGLRDESQMITKEEAERRALEHDRIVQEAMERSDQLHEMAAAGFKPR